MPPDPKLSPVPASRSRRQIILWIALMLLALGAMLAAPALYRHYVTEPRDKARAAAAKQLLYDTLGRAARQQIVQVSMYRATFTDEAAAKAATNPAGEASTIAGIDVSRRDYRSLYAYRMAGQPTFDLGRCLAGKDYRDFRPQAQRPTTLKQAAASLNPIQPATVSLTFNPCPQLGIRPGGTTDTMAARLSDGFFPVTLTDSQADAWTAKLKAADLFTVTDEGLTTKDGRSLRKLSFKPAPGVTGTNKRLYQIFYDAADIATYQAMEKPPLYQYEYASIGVLSHGNISGYYLIDEATKLPVFSQLAGSGSDNISGQSEAAAGVNVARTKQHYTFPKQLTLNLDTPLDFVQ